jgi:hypothetical protein
VNFWLGCLIAVALFALFLGGAALLLRRSGSRSTWR